MKLKPQLQLARKITGKRRVILKRRGFLKPLLFPNNNVNNILQRKQHVAVDRNRPDIAGGNLFQRVNLYA
jgi:hypothetical protein